MTDTPPGDEPTLFPRTAGERLREAREAQGLSLAEIAARTRVPVRQLEAIETGDYAALPSITYSVGFAKAYARAVGADEVAIARDVRAANDQPAAVRRTDYQAYEIDEPSRVPSRGVVVGALLAALLLVVGAALFYGTAIFRGAGDAPPAPVATQAVPETAPVAAPRPAAPSGQVVLTATDEVWLKVYEKGGRMLYLGTLKAGETFAVPTDAQAPLINVGRPDKLRVTVGGAPVAPLGDGKVALKDVAINAAALVARGGGASQPLPTPAPGAGPAAIVPQTPVSSPSPSPRPSPRPTARAPSASAPLNIAAPVPVAPEPAVPAPAGTPAP